MEEDNSIIEITNVCNVDLKEKIEPPNTDLYGRATSVVGGSFSGMVMLSVPDPNTEKEYKNKYNHLCLPPYKQIKRMEVLGGESIWVKENLLCVLLFKTADSEA